MAIDAIGLSGASDTNVPRNASISQESFLKILLTQLRFQDPLKPVDNQQFVAQLAQFSALELNRQQAEKTDSLLQIDASGQALTLIGRTVEVRQEAGGQVGVVTDVSFSTDGARLTLRTSAGTPVVNVRMSDLVRVRAGA